MKVNRRWLWLLLLPLLLMLGILAWQPTERITFTYISTATNQWGAKTMFFCMTNATRRELELLPGLLWVDEKLAMTGMTAHKTAIPLFQTGDLH